MMRVATLLTALYFGSALKEDGVLILTDENFEELVAKSKDMIVQFYSPWQEESGEFAPEFAEAAKTLQHSTIELAKIDASIHRTSAEKHSPEHIPTLVYFKNGSPQGYFNDSQLNQNAFKITQWAVRKAALVLQGLKGIDEVWAWEKKAEVLGTRLLGVFDDEKGAEADQWREFAAANHNFVFAICSNASVKEEYGLSGGVNVVMFNTEGDKPKRFVYTPSQASDFTKDHVETWVDTHLLAPASVLSDKHFDRHVRNILVLVTKDAASEEQMETLRKVGAEHVGDLYTTCAVLSDYLQLENRLYVTQQDLPALRMIYQFPDGKTHKFGPSTPGFTEELTRLFVRDYLAGDLKPMMKSEAEFDGDAKVQGFPIQQLVGVSHDAVVHTPGVSAFVMYYNHWCANCTEVYDRWTDLSLELGYTPNLVFGQLDTEENELPDLDLLEATPCFKLYPAGTASNTDAMEYTQLPEAQTVEGLMKFIKEHVPSAREGDPKKAELRKQVRNMMEAFKITADAFSEYPEHSSREDLLNIMHDILRAEQELNPREKRHPRDHQDL